MKICVWLVMSKPMVFFVLMSFSIFVVSKLWQIFPLLRLLSEVYTRGKNFWFFPKTIICSHTVENIWGLNTSKRAKEKQWYSLLIFFFEVVDNFSNYLWEKAVWKIISFKGTICHPINKQGICCVSPNFFLSKYHEKIPL